jgi:hypothetical protein
MKPSSVKSSLSEIRKSSWIVTLPNFMGFTKGNLNKAVKRNLKRFPDDFMLQLTEEEFKILNFQNGISKWGGTRKMPFAFTEQGVAMLSFLSSRQRLMCPV